MQHCGQFRPHLRYDTLANTTTGVTTARTVISLTKGNTASKGSRMIHIPAQNPANGHAKNTRITSQMIENNTFLPMVAAAAASIADVVVVAGSRIRVGFLPASPLPLASVTNCDRSG